jgi:hypothetical protein
MRSLVRSRYVALASVAVAAPLWSACSSSSSGGGRAAKPPAALCQKLGGIFADGPDPDADPVGYALAQINALASIRTTNYAVRAAVTKLVPADRALVSSNGSDHAATATIKKEDAALNRSCPGVDS